MKDYSELEGMVIDCDCTYGKIKGKVVGCDFDVGITIVDNEDNNNYVNCLLRPSSTLWKDGQDSFDSQKTEIMFHVIVNQIKKKQYNETFTARAYNAIMGCGCSHGASANTCAFAQ